MGKKATMEEHEGPDEIRGETPMQAHTCTAVIEELAARTPESEWEGLE